MVEIHIRHGQASAETGWGLTKEGKRQAQAVAAYLQTHYPEAFTIGVHSGSRRAMETAQLLGLPDIEWANDARLREADWQGNPEPRKFEPWQEMYAQVAAACRDWDTQSAGKNRVVVSHGGTMRMVRAYREGLTGSRFHLLFEEPYKYFTNCQILIYTNESPKNGTIDPEKLWVKSVCPWDEGRFGHDWVRSATFLPFRRPSNGPRPIR
ncbi:MAG: phosphoglycerate mutase family domain containing protein [Patescibacteria group bacterium]|nr:phosphoglycerate mutase family domain containing protein [Patescibacteria group bacterium]